MTLFIKCRFSVADSYFQGLEIERYCDENVPIISIPQTTAKKTDSAKTSPNTSDNEKTNIPMKNIPISVPGKRTRKNGPKQYKQNTIKKFVGKKKKYMHMSKEEIMKDYYLNHCGLCQIRFKELDENMKLGMSQMATFKTRTKVHQTVYRYYSSFIFDGF